MNSSLPERSYIPSSSRGSLAGLFIASTIFAATLVRGSVVVDAIDIGPGEIFPVYGPSGAAGLLLDTLTLTISPSGILDLKDNAIIVRTTNHAVILGYVRVGYNGGGWNGIGGIQSSTAAADPERKAALGTIDNSEARYTSFEGRATTAFTETLVKFTQYGDANLDGVVDQLDVALMGTGSGLGWYHGDFDYSGTVDQADYALLFAAFPEGGPVVPEPGTAALLGVGALAAGWRRRGR